MVSKPAVVIVAVVAMLISTNAHAQFGRNRVHYDRLDFRLLQTPHFDIYYYDDEEEAVGYAAQMAERWYARFSSILHHTFAHRQPLILYASHSHFVQTNLSGGPVGEGIGGFTERTKSRIAMPFTPGLGETEHVLGHEIAHAFQIDIAKSVKQDAFSLPGWFIEGMAEYLSLGPATAHTSMWVRDAARHNRLPTLEQLNDPKYFPYRFGHALWSYLAGEYGDRLFGDVLRSRARGGIKRLEQVTGRTAMEITRAWHDSIPAASSARPEVDGLVIAGRQGRMQLGPALSPDGRRVMFLSERDRLSVDLFLADTEKDKGARKIVSTAADSHFDSLQYIDSSGAWDRSGHRFVIAAVRSGQAMLALVDVTRGDREEIPLPGVSQVFNPSWSPDGSQIVVSGLKGGLADLFIYSVTTKTLRQLTADPFADVQPAWSPDGSTLAFATDRFTSSVDELRFGSLRVGLLDLESGVIRPLDSSHASRETRDKEINPQWSPDGEAIYYIADRAQTSNVYRRVLATGELTRVTDEAFGVSGLTPTSPALAVASQSGAVAFTTFSDGVYRIRMLDDCSRCVVEAALASTSPETTDERMTVAAALRDPLTGLADASSFTRRPYDDRLRLETLAQPFIGAGTGNAFGGILRASFGATFGDLLRNRQLQTMFRVGTDMDDFAAQIAYSTRRGRWTWGLTGGFAPARFSGARRSLERGTESTTRETTSLRYDHQWFGGAARYHIDAARRVEARVGIRRTGFQWQTATRTTSTGGQVLDRTFVESPAGPALYQAEAQLAFVHDTSVFGPIGPVLGQRVRVEVEPVFGSVPFTDVRVDARRYWMPLRPLTVAARIEHIGRYGSGAPDARLTPLVVGLQTMVRGYDLRNFAVEACGRMATACSVIDELAGSRMALMNVELRMPLLGFLTGDLDYGRQVPIELIAFADAGALWSKHVDGTDRTRFRSIGAGGRANMGGIVIEVTAARPFDRTPVGWTVGFLVRPGW